MCFHQKVPAALRDLYIPAEHVPAYVPRSDDHKVEYCTYLCGGLVHPRALTGDLVRSLTTVCGRYRCAATANLERVIHTTTLIGVHVPSNNLVVGDITLTTTA